MLKMSHYRKVSLLGMGIAAVISVIVWQALVSEQSVMFDSSLRVLPAPADAQNYPVGNVPVSCVKNFNEVRSLAKFSVMTPHVLPVGYSLQGANYVLDANVADGAKEVTLYYWDKPLCEFATQYAGGPSLNGAIVLHVTNYPEITDTKPALQSIIDTSEPEYNVHYVTISPYLGVGWEPGNGKSIFILEDGTVVQEGTFPYPGRVMFYVSGADTNILYHIEANMPLDDILKIAKSIQ